VGTQCYSSSKATFGFPIAAWNALGVPLENRSSGVSKHQRVKGRTVTINHRDADDHDASVWDAPGGHRWFASCDCGWRITTPALCERVARELAATHYLADDDSRGLLAATIARLPAGLASIHRQIG